jgi:UDP-GlcNAc3NAcA epimerase
MHILTVVGARPQFIKAAVVGRALVDAVGIRQTLLHTGQHYDNNMSTVFFDELEMSAPDIDLAVRSSSHGDMTGRMLSGIERVLQELQPDAVLVYGDTNSTLAGALSAVKLHIPVAHVEAGLRSYNRRMPEEINRVLTDHASDLLFAPSEHALRNLEREGIAGARVSVVGDVMYDAVLAFRNKAERHSEILSRLSLADVPYVLGTVHRAENTDDPRRLGNILAALARLSRTIRIVLPLHPRTLAVLKAQGIAASAAPGLVFIEPVGYLDMACLESNAALIVTDSGGVQKEAYFHRVPCVTVRDETEWLELVASGWNRLASPDDPGAMFDAMCGAIGTVGTEVSLFGGGDSGPRIVAALKSKLGRFYAGKEN